MSELSLTDRKLIAALSRDSRASITTLSKDIGVSRATVQSSLNKLVASGTIRKFTIETDPHAHAEVVRAITMIEVKGNLTSSVVKSLKTFSDVTRVSSTNGAWDLVVQIETASLAEFDSLLRKLRELPGVLNSETSLLLNTLI